MTSPVRTVRAVLEANVSGWMAGHSEAGKASKELGRTSVETGRVVGDAARKSSGVVESSAAKVVAARRSEADAAGVTRTAEARLAESRTRYAEGTAKNVAAEESYARAQRASAAATRGVVTAEGEAMAARQRRATQTSAFSRLATTGGAIVKGGALGGAIVGAASVHAAANFQTLTTQLVTGAGEQASNLAMVSAGLLKLSGDVGISADTLAKGLYTINSAGIRGADGLKVLKSAAEGALAGNADLTQTTDALTSVMQSYNTQLAASHKPLLTSNQIMDQLIATEQSGKLHMDDLTASLSNVVPRGSAAGLSFAQLGGAIATMTNHGESAQRASENLANAIIHLEAPTQISRKTMAQYGVDATNVAQHLGQRGLTGTINLLSDAVIRRMGPSGLALQDTLNKSKSYAQDAVTMLDRLPPSLQKLGRSFLAGKGDTSAWNGAVKDLNMYQQNLAGQFLMTAKHSLGFSDTLRRGGPQAQTYSAAMASMLGGMTGLNVATMLGMANAPVFAKNVQHIGEAAKTSGSHVEGWALVQKNFNQRMHETGQQIAAIGIRLGTILIPKVEAVVSATKAVVEWFGRHKTAAKVLADVIAGVLTLAVTAYAINLTTRFVGSVSDATKAVERMAVRMAGVGAVANAEAGAAGGFGKFAGFLTGPWGLAIGAAVLVIGRLAWAHQDAKKKAQAFADTLDHNTAALGRNSDAMIVNVLQQQGAFKAANTLGISLHDVMLAAEGNKAAIQRVNAAEKAAIATAQAHNHVLSESGNVTTAADIASIKLNNTIFGGNKIVDAGIAKKRADIAAEKERRLALDGTTKAAAGASSTTARLTTNLTMTSQMARNTARDLNITAAAARNMPKAEQINVTAFGYIGGTGPYAHKPLPLAEGGPVPLLPGSKRHKDSVHALLMPDEYVIDEHGSNLVDAIEHYLGKARPMATGGPVGPRMWPTFESRFDSKVGGMTVAAMQKMVGAFMNTAAALPFLGGAGGGSILTEARRFLGVPYLWGGTTPGGFDCSGFTGYVMQHAGLHPPRTAAQQQGWATPESAAAATPGDLVFFGNPAHHVAFYEGGNRMISADRPGTIIKEEGVWGESHTYGRPVGLSASASGDPSRSSFGAGGTGGYRTLGLHTAQAMGVGGQFGAIDYIFSRESGWNPRAQNPTSSAYGIPQFLDSTWAKYGGKTADPAQQIHDGIAYMAGRYGSPNNAANFWKAHHWYDKGGVINEPVIGRGMRSGHSYSFAERGPETVVPGRAYRGPTGGGYTASVTAKDQQLAVVVNLDGRQVHRALVKIKRDNGGVRLGLD